MSLLEDAKRLDDPLLVIRNDEYGCPFCGAHEYTRQEFVHESDCPWLAMPRIVAALEAASKVAASDPCFRDEVPDPGIVSRCVFCLWVPSLEGHHPDCEHQALVAALEGAG